MAGVDRVICGCGGGAIFQNDLSLLHKHQAHALDCMLHFYEQFPQVDQRVASATAFNFFLQGAPSFMLVGLTPNLADLHVKASVSTTLASGMWSFALYVIRDHINHLWGHTKRSALYALSCCALATSLGTYKGSWKGAFIFCVLNQGPPFISEKDIFKCFKYPFEACETLLTGKCFRKN